MTPTRRVAILPDMREMTEPQIRSLKTFVDHGNTLLISGLTAFYGPHAKAWALAGFPLADITGARLSEAQLPQLPPTVSLGDTPSLPSRMWLSTITPQTAEPLSKQHGDVVATRLNVHGGGSVVWIPSPIGLGAWLTDAQPIALYLQHDILPNVQPSAFLFAEPVSGCLLRVLDADAQHLTVVTNGRAEPVRCVLTHSGRLHPATLWGEEPAPTKRATKTIVNLAPRGTSVLLWR